MAAQLYGKCIFCFVKTCQSILQSTYTILHSHQQCMSNAISLYPCQHLVLSLFFSIFLIMIQFKYHKTHPFKAYDSVGFSICTITTTKQQNILSYPKEILHTLAVVPHSPLLLPAHDNHQYTFCFYRLAYSRRFI